MVTIHNLSTVIKSTLPQIVFILLITLSQSTSVLAETTLNATVDRNKIYQQDTINLSVSGEIDMEFSIGGLMDFSRSKVTEPELGDLLTDFEILDQNQSYNMRSINGDTKAQVSWNYTLTPKRTGLLTIPAIEYQGAASNEIRIEVLAGKPPRNADTPPMVFIEAVVDKQSAYVQEQVVYTLRLYSADHLASGDLTEPSPENAIVEGLGDTKKYFRMAYNQRYEVRERQYLIFPQKSGQLTIEPQSFNGMLIDTRSRKRSRVRETSDAIRIDVKAPPGEFNGKIWLPATSLELSETWDKEPYDLSVGDSVTRTIEIRALGLLGSALPPFQKVELKGLKIYPDQPILESFEHDSGAQSRRSETSAMVAISPHEVTLPEVKIPWWDTVNDVQRVAVLPSRTFTIQPSPDQPESSPPPVSTPTVELKQAQASADDSLQSDTPTESAPVIVETTSSSQNNHPWYIIIFLLISGWITTTWLLLKRQKNLNSTKAVFEPAKPAIEELLKAIKEDSPEIPKRLIAWANELHKGSQTFQSINDLKKIDKTIYQTAFDIEKQLYGLNHSQQGITFDKAELIKRIKAHTKRDKADNSTALQAMYP